jgi:predicted PurR-regulated permease PerM
VTLEPPAPPETLAQLARQIGRLWVAYIKGQLVYSLIMGILTWVVGAAIGLSHALPLGLLAGIMETVPGVGAILAAIPAAVVALWRGSSVIAVENWVFALIVVGVYVLLQQIGELLIKPRVFAHELHLHPLVVLAAILIGALVANVVGAYLAVPLLVTVREIVRYVRYRLRPSKNI